jgi:hypothetical protein
VTLLVWLTEDKRIHHRDTQPHNVAFVARRQRHAVDRRRRRQQAIFPETLPE